MSLESKGQCFLTDVEKARKGKEVSATCRSACVTRPAALSGFYLVCSRLGTMVQLAPLSDSLCRKKNFKWEHLMLWVPLSGHEGCPTPEAQPLHERPLRFRTSD